MASRTRKEKALAHYKRALELGFGAGADPRLNIDVMCSHVPFTISDVAREVAHARNLDDFRAQFPHLPVSAVLYRQLRPPKAGLPNCKVRTGIEGVDEGALADRYESAMRAFAVTRNTGGDLGRCCTFEPMEFHRPYPRR
jgi:hypothetical protein